MVPRVNRSAYHPSSAKRVCVGPLTPTGDIMNAFFSVLLIRKVDAFDNTGADQATLATALNIRRNRDDPMMDWLRASLTPGNVSPLLAVLARYFAHPHSDLIKLVRAYEHKWHGAWASASPPDLATVHAHVKAWLAKKNVPL